MTFGSIQTITEAMIIFTLERVPAYRNLGQQSKSDPPFSRCFGCTSDDGLKRVIPHQKKRSKEHPMLITVDIIHRILA